MGSALELSLLTFLVTAMCPYVLSHAVHFLSNMEHDNQKRSFLAPKALSTENLTLDQDAFKE